MPFFSRTTLERVARLAMASALLCLACGEVPRSEDTALSPERLGAQVLLATSGGQWSPAGALATARQFPTATLLPSGQVLLAGGQGPGNALLASAEVYDPATGKWSPTGSLTTARVGHAAALLPSGQVLLAGGYGPSDEFLASAEVYDPATGKWNPTGSLATARHFPTATLLPSGQVLLAGGQGPSYDPLASVEVYDPVTGTWNSTGAMAVARVAPTATLLPSGQVLLAGGRGLDDEPLASAEVFDPATGKWSPTGAMAVARVAPTATLLPSGQVLLAGGRGLDDEPLASAEVFDPATGKWSPTARLATARQFHTATPLPSGQVLVTGGRGPGNEFLASAELYDPVTGRWIPVGPLATARQFHTATPLPSGQVLVTGGQGPSLDPLASTEVFDLELPTAVVVTPLQGSTTPDDRPTYQGNAEADSTVTLFVDGVAVGTPQASASGEWSFQQPVALRDGGHTVRARATTAAGLTGPDSSAHTFTVDTLPPAAPVLIFPANGAWSNDNRPVYGGTAEADHTVTVLVDGREVDTTTANASGEWGLRQPQGLAEGSHTVRVHATDALGHTSPDSNLVVFTVDTLAPDAPELSVPPFFTPQQPVIVVGTAEPHSSVTVWLDGSVASTVQADETGNWVFTPTHALPEGDHKLKATARDAAGNEGPFSKDYTLTIQGERSFYSSGCSTAPPLSAPWALLALFLCLRGRHRAHTRCPEPGGVRQARP